jgi:hypothetical protein
MSLLEQAEVCELYAAMGGVNAEYWRREGVRCREGWAAALAEPRSTLPLRIAAVVETDFPKFAVRDKRLMCQAWQDEYRTRPKRDADEIDHDEDMTDALGRLVKGYRRIEIEGDESPDEWLARFVALARTALDGSDPDLDAMS